MPTATDTADASSENFATSTLPDSILEKDLNARLAKLNLEEKIRLLTGADFWTLHEDPTIGLRKIVLSDGPAGIRGESWDERDSSLNLPSGSALGATWDVDVARRYGDVLGREARRKKVDVVLGPTINLHRSPYGGRHFEAMSEDPLLTAQLAAAYVDGLQRHGIAACPKHYVANDYEVDRYTASSEVDERALREIYLAAFELAVTEAQAWVIMSAYNSVNGTPMSEHPLLSDPLKAHWGFDGVVVSDWAAVRTTVESARAAQDLVMPSLMSPWENALVEAVKKGQVTEESIDDKVLRILRLAARVGALEDIAHAPRALVEDGDPVETVANFAADGMVLLRNENELPWDRAPRSIAVIGPYALSARTQGGGSATVSPAHVTSPLQGLRKRFPEADITFHMGVEAPNGIFPLSRSQLRDPRTGGEGLHLELTSTDGRVLIDEVRYSSELSWLGTLPLDAGTLIVRTTFTPESTERSLLGVGCAVPFQLNVDGATVLEVVPDSTTEGLSSDIAKSIFAPPVSAVPVSLTAGEPLEIEVTCDLSKAPLPSIHAMILGIAPYSGTPDEMLAEAMEAARNADAVVVVVGTSARTESEGFDRTTLALPGDQDHLVEAIARSNQRTVVVVNAGSPVLMPWRESVSAVLLAWFGGQEIGTAVAAVLAGDREPGGRLPTTWPADESSAPLGPDQPVDQKVHYNESIHIGHRGWLRASSQPAYWFGHGLTFTSWEFAELSHPATVRCGESILLEVAVTNTGGRRGKQVVQVYASKDDSEIERPVRWLVGFATAHLDPGERGIVQIEIAARQLSSWVNHEWWQELGTFELLVGTSVADIMLTSSVDVVS